MTIEELKESLLASPKNGYNLLTAEQKADMEAYCKRYMAFIDACKTEREATAWAVAEAEKQGFKPLTADAQVKPGDKYYLNNRGKALLLAHIGQKSLAEGAQIAAAHIDAPRLDLKPNPLYEESEMAFFKTH